MLPISMLLDHSNIYKNVALSSTGVLVKGASTEVYHMHIGNTNASAVFVHFYNKATAPTTGTDVPVMTYLIPSSGVYAEELVDPAWFPLGFGVSCTTGSADNDSTPPGTAIVVNFIYK